MTDFLKTKWQKMSASVRVILLCAIAVVGILLGVLFAAGTSPAQQEPLPQDYAQIAGMEIGGSSDIDDCGMYVRWGDTNAAASDAASAPEFAVAAYKDGGSWANVGNRPCWHADAADGNAAALRLEVDRQMLTSNATLELTFFDHQNSTLDIDLYDTNDTTVATNILGNLSLGSNADTTVWLDIPFARYPNAVGIAIRRSSGEATVYESLLYFDHNGLSADQERQIGTADLRLSWTGGTQSSASDADTMPDSAQGTTPEAPSSTNMTENGNSGTNSLQTPLTVAAVKLIYVDKKNGNDALSGLATAVAGTAGPKKTIKGGLDVAESGDTLVIKSGQYGENLDVAGRSISVVIDGNVDISGNSGVVNVASPLNQNPANFVGVITNSSGM